MPNSDDPFFNSPSDNTVIRPIPGGRKKDIERQLTGGFEPEQYAISLLNLGKINPLEGAASALLSIISRLYHSPSHDDPIRLKQQLQQEVKAFELNADKANYDPQMIQEASYSLCTTLDEAILNTPWGQESGWGQQSLLSTFHHDVSGGDQFFKRLKQRAQVPSKYLHLLELKYICLALGFQGRYRIDESGNHKLKQIREWLAQVIRKEKGTTEPLLSPHWHGVVAERKGLLKIIPLWVMFSVAGVLLTLLFSGLWLSLNAKAEPVRQTLSNLTIQKQDIPPKVNEYKLLQKLFEKEINNNLVVIRDPKNEQGRNVIELLGSKGVAPYDQELFVSGRDKITKNRDDLITTVAKTLSKPPFNKYIIKIKGYSDSQPYRGRRYSGNMELSTARAESIKKLLLENNPALEAAQDRIEPSGEGVSKIYKGQPARMRHIDIIVEHSGSEAQQ